MMVEESLSYLIKPLKINPEISEELESVAKIGFNLDGFAEVAKCNVLAQSSISKNEINTKNFTNKLYT